MNTINQNNLNNQTILKKSFNIFKSIIKYILLFGFFINILSLSIPLFSMQVFDRVLSTHNTNTLFMLTILIFFSLLLLFFINISRSIAINNASNWLYNSLSSHAISNSILLSLESKNITGSQQIRDLQSLKIFLNSFSLISIMDLPWAIIFIFALFTIHCKFGYMSLYSSFLLIIIGLLSDRLNYKLLKRNNELFIFNLNQLDQATRNSESIESMGMRNYIISSWSKTNVIFQKIQNVVNFRQLIFIELIKFIRLIVQVLIISIGAYLVIIGEISPGSIIAGSSLINRALIPFESTINSLKNSVLFFQSFDRLNKSFIYCNSLTKKSFLKFYSGSFEFQNVYYGLAKNIQYTLKAINILINSGTILGIIGNSGSGKTTFIKLLLGILNPNLGSIILDGHNLNNLDKIVLGKDIGYLSQNVELFSGTIKDNIARMNDNPNHNDVILAAQIAGVHNIIINLPNGYNYNIGTDGSMLSGGQKQRIALARAFYGNPKLIILDEPNSCLDSDGENALIKSLLIARERKATVVIISHKLNIIKLVDKIILLKNGAIVMFGDKDFILNKINMYNY